jgi:hypothetical protein
VVNNTVDTKRTPLGVLFVSTVSSLYTSCMKKIIYCSCIVAAFFFLGGMSAEAHTLKSDGVVSVLMHLEPHGTTLIGKPAVINLEFKSDPSVVDISRCNCSFTLIKGDTQIFKRTIKEGEATTMGNTIFIPYTFSETGDYTLNVSGVTSTSSPFSLSYPIVVVDSDHVMADIEGHHHPAGHTLHIILFGGAILLSAYVILKKDKSNVTKV